MLHGLAVRLKALDFAFDHGPIRYPGRIGTRGKTGDEGLEALEASSVEPPQLGQRVFVVVDAKVERRVVFACDDAQGRRLLAALVAAGRFARLQRGDQSSGEIEVRAVCVSLDRRLEHRRAREHVAGDGEIGTRDVAAPSDAFAARVRRGTALPVDDVYLPNLTPGVAGDQALDHPRRLVPLRKEVEAGRPITGIHQRLRRERSDAAARMKAQGADGEETAGHRDSQGAVAGAGDNGPGHARLFIDLRGGTVPGTVICAHYNAVSRLVRLGTPPCQRCIMAHPSAPPEAFNLAAHLITRNASRADRIAYIDDRTRLSYGELADQIRRFAQVLRDNGLRREERVLLLAYDTVEWPVAFLGAIYAGVVPVAVNTLLTADDYGYMLSNSRARAAIVSAALLPTLVQAMQLRRHDVEAVWVIGPTAALAPGQRDFGADLAKARPVEPATTHADDAAFWLYSSGSTGAPKGTVHTHANAYWTDALYAQNVLQLTENDVCFSAAKLFFAYGLGNALTFPLSAGATTILMGERPTPQSVFKRLIEQRPTVFFGVPTLYAAMLASPDLPARSAVRLRICTSAGEALPRDIGERFTAHFGVEILDGIGSTEMLHIFLSNRAGNVHYGTTGLPVPGYDVELRGDDGRPVADGEVGDLYIRGPSAALMYWTNRDKSRATFQGEWTKSGDKYLRREDGCYVYAGRGDDMLKVSGLYVSPFEVEAALVQHPAVLEAAVIGRTDAEGLTKTKAFVVLKAGSQADAGLEETLKAFVKDKLAPYKYPRSIEFITELPKTATGKIQRFRLREREQGHVP